jgi:hypothetical protein
MTNEGRGPGTHLKMRANKDACVVCGGLMSLEKSTGPTPCMVSFAQPIAKSMLQTSEDVDDFCSICKVADNTS